jgi:hypothetical protein
VNERTPPAALEAMYQKALLASIDDPESPSDIHQHLPILRELAESCEHVTEFGTRRANGSTLAFLAAQPAVFIAWDINPWSIVQQRVADLLSMGIDEQGRWSGRIGRTDFQPRCGDTLAIEPIEHTDLLFIDTYHTRTQLLAELARHCDPGSNPGKTLRVRKYLAFHDTSTFGERGEDGSEPGLLDAVRYYQRKFAFPLWGLKYQHTNNNGLIVLERIDVDPAGGVSPAPGRERFK